MKKHKNSETLAIAIKTKEGETPISTMTAKYKEETYELLLISSRKDMRESIFNARPDTKQTHFLLQLDHKQQIIKILSNPKDYE